VSTTWETRKAKYGQSGAAEAKPSDKITDAENFARLKAKCKEMPNGCWEYQGFRHPAPRNYGLTCYRNKNWRTNRLAYFLTKGPIPKGMVVMHCCDNPPCCNPNHLSLGTHLQNMAACRERERYYYANLTHCKHGHEFNEENTYYIPTPGKFQGLRKCRACQRRMCRERYHRDIELARAKAKMYRERKKAKVTAGTVGACG